jgi:hypothetical protein
VKGYDVILPYEAFDILSHAEGIAIRCRTCGMISHNQNDVRNLYCGKCHKFHERG